VSRWKFWVFALLPVSGLIIAAEFVCRELGPPPADTLSVYPERFVAGQFMLDIELGWSLRPGNFVTHAAFPKDSLPISPEGLRDDPLRYPRPEDEPRILCLGDSSVMGAGVSRADTFSSLLQDRFPGSDFINAGVPGYSSYQILIMMDRLRVVGADGVIAYLMNSDLMPGERNTDDAYFHRVAVGPTRILKRSALWWWLHHLSDRWANQNLEAAVTNRVGLARFQENVRTMIALAHQGDMELVLVVPPTRATLPDRELDKMQITSDSRAEAAESWLQGSNAWGRPAYYIALSLEAYRAGVVLVDGPRYFKEAIDQNPALEDTLFLDSLHPSSAGHRLLADALTPPAAAIIEGSQRAP